MSISTMQNSAAGVGAPYTSTTTSPRIVDNNATDSMLGGVSKNDFLKLLVAQLSNQDPMNPMQDKEFLTQVAQLNTVEQLNNLNANLTELLSFESLSQASTLIGKSVQALTPQGQTIKGVVKAVSVEQGTPMLVVADQKIAISDVQRITSA